MNTDLARLQQFPVIKGTVLDTIEDGLRRVPSSIRFRGRKSLMRRLSDAWRTRRSRLEGSAMTFAKSIIYRSASYTARWSCPAIIP
jgi:hypothetical protein